jgi:hypothetical protein
MQSANSEGSMSAEYDPAADPVHGSGWNSAARWGGWHWEDPRGAEHFRRCSFCGSVHPEDLAAETPGTGTCTACGQHGWEACFRGQEHADIKAAVRDGKLDVSTEERERVLALTDEHSYDPGGWYASWADRKYGWPHKFYAKGVVNRHPEVLRIMTALSPGQEDRMEQETGYQWFPVSEIPAGADVSGWRLEDGHYSHVGLGSDETHFVKFYTIHLADPAISQDVKDKIQQASGLAFEFTADGHVSWRVA